MKAEHYLGLVCLIVVAISAYFGHIALEVGAGYSAKVVCSATFTSGRDFNQVVIDEIGLPIPIYSISKGENYVFSSALFGLINRKAIFYPNRNSCTLAAPGESTTIWDNYPTYKETSTSHASQEWPTGDKNSEDKNNSNIDYTALKNLMEASFHEALLKETGVVRDTRAVIVLYDGKVIAEKYAPGYSASTPLLGWSMTKSVLSTLIGSRVQEKKMDLTDSHLLSSWENDKRSEITLGQLLKATSGLKFKETNDVFSDTSDMLFKSADLVEYASNKALVNEPGSVWSYSSGTSNILAQCLRQSFENDGGDEAYWKYAKDFFSRLGMDSMVLDTDASGTYVGSSFSHANLRDWARFGLFAAQRGNWEGEQIISEEWFDFALAPSSASPRGEYGAQWWLNVGNKDNSSDRYYPSLPTDTFMAQGYQGQYVAVIPSKKLVAVRLGATSPDTAWNMEGFLNYMVENVIRN